MIAVDTVARIMQGDLAHFSRPVYAYLFGRLSLILHSA
jgi:hypothetical protein